jgi:hypothetical protein
MGILGRAVALAVSPRWYRPLMVGLTVLFLILGAFVGSALLRATIRDGLMGADYRLFGEIGRRWAEDGSMYAPWQLTGPYRYDRGLLEGDIVSMPTLYPPYAGPVFAVVRYIPPILWWGVPLGAVGWLVARWRPAPWSWPIIALAAVSPNSWGILAAGGSSMWIAMFVAFGLPARWPAALVAIKPTFLPLAILGWRSRWTWLLLCAFATGAVLSPAELSRYRVALENVEGVTLFYSVGDLPFVFVPIVAWIARATKGRTGIASPLGGAAGRD